MAAVTRIGDLCTGHDIFPPRALISGSIDYIVCGKGAGRVGDILVTHIAVPPILPPHDGAISAGQPSFLVNGLPIARVGDPVSCGSFMASGCESFLVG